MTTVSVSRSCNAAMRLFQSGQTQLNAKTTKPIPVNKTA
jgi:hypothetical protein